MALIRDLVGTVKDVIQDKVVDQPAQAQNDGVGYPLPETDTKTAQAPQAEQSLAPPPAKAPTSHTLDQPDVSPVTTELDPEKETVEGRLANLTAPDSRYVQVARENAMRSANTRGLINSSIAAAQGERAAIEAALPIASEDAQAYGRRAELNQNTQNEFLKNVQSANLNKELASFNNLLSMEKEANSAALKTQADLILNDAKFSDEMKLQYVSTINNIMRDTQDQITQIGLSDRSAAQQATAIEMANANRDAAIQVYSDLLGGFDDWDWGTDFTPVGTTPAAVNNNWNAPGGVQLTQEPKVGTIIDGQRYAGSGVWNPVPVETTRNYDDYWYD